MQMKRHRRVVFEVNEEGKDFVINPSVYTVAKINPTCIFKNLDPGARPIATKSRRFSWEGQQFIRSEVKKLLDDNTIEPTTSPWRLKFSLLMMDGKKGEWLSIIFKLSTSLPFWTHNCFQELMIKLIKLLKEEFLVH